MMSARHRRVLDVPDISRRRPGETGAVTDDRDHALPDGTYDALVVDISEASDTSDSDTGGGTVAVELTIIAGPAKGEVVTLRATGLEGDPLDLLGVPATITVADGAPSVRFEP
jgi:hypothetical protein